MTILASEGATAWPEAVMMLGFFAMIAVIVWAFMKDQRK